MSSHSANFGRCGGGNRIYGRHAYSFRLNTRSRRAAPPKFAISGNLWLPRTPPRQGRRRARLFRIGAASANSLVPTQRLRPNSRRLRRVQKCNEAENRAPVAQSHRRLTCEYTDSQPSAAGLNERFEELTPASATIYLRVDLR